MTLKTAITEITKTFNWLWWETQLQLCYLNVVSFNKHFCSDNGTKSTSQDGKTPYPPADMTGLVDLSTEGVLEKKYKLYVNHGNWEHNINRWWIVNPRSCEIARISRFSDSLRLS